MKSNKSNDIFSNIKSWIYNLFHGSKMLEEKKENSKADETYNNSKNDVTIKKTYFEEQIEKSERHAYLIELQKKYKNHLILEENMSDDDKKDLESLYITQNNELKRKIRTLNIKMLKNNN